MAITEHNDGRFILLMSIIYHMAYDPVESWTGRLVCRLTLTESVGGSQSYYTEIGAILKEAGEHSR
jgi:hypothetical protein